jgi:lysyl-tRNA synthetase class 2
MDDTNALIKQRKEKLEALRAKGIDPFKNKFAPTEKCAEARANYVEGREVALAGRITAHRDMGKSQFIDIKDQSGRMQVYAQKQALGDEQFEVFKHLDLGDFVGVRGTMFTTKTGEISVKLAAFVILGKALRPPPAKWHGLEDTEIRYRQRYLDLMANDEVRQVFLKRSEIVREIRSFLHSRGFVEVETPMMQAIPGGAAAQPFVTRHKALGCEFYLRIALELYLKRLLVGGIDRVFEIGRNFRNEGLSRKHNPEFTMLEAYQAYGDYESMMELVQSMICHVAERVLGTLIIIHDQSSYRVSSALRNLTTKVSNLRVPFGAAVDEMIGDEEKKLKSLESETTLKEYEKAEKAKTSLAKVIDLLKNDAKSANPRLIWSDDLKNRILQSSDPLFSFDAMQKEFDELSKPSKRIDLTPPWRRVKYKDLVREFAHPNWFEFDKKKKLQFAADHDIEVADIPLNKIKTLQRQAKDVREWSQHEKDDLAKRGVELLEYYEKGIEDFEITQAVFEKRIEPTLINPTFVTHAPKELIPLAKLSPDDPTTVEVFECCINGQEIAPAYTEQNDPIQQRERLEHQAGGEQQKLDEDFLVALEHGMPPAGGMGLGIDRLCMMLLGQENIRDVILFPQLKPKP